MNSKSVFKDFTKYVLLNILGQIAYSCYTLADTFFVSANLGANGLTALNLAFPIFCLINGTGLMIGMGGGTRYSILKSRGDNNGANQIFTNAVYLVAVLAVLFVLSGLFFSSTIVRLLGADDTIFFMTNTYLRVMLLFAPAFLANNLLQCFVRNDGNPSLSTAAIISGSLSMLSLTIYLSFRFTWEYLEQFLPPDWLPLSASLFCLPISLAERTNFIFQNLHLIGTVYAELYHAEYRHSSRKQLRVLSCSSSITLFFVWRGMSVWQLLALLQLCRLWLFQYIQEYRKAFSRLSAGVLA